MFLSIALQPSLRPVSGFVIFPLVFSMACASDNAGSSPSDTSDSSSSSGGATPGNGGGSSSDGNATGGESSGGTAAGDGGSPNTGGSTGTGGAAALADEHCSPGDLVSGFFLGSGTLTTCDNWNPGNEDMDISSARSIKLPTPTSPNEPYAISFLYLSPGNGEIVYFATDGECGPVLEELGRDFMNNKELICTDSLPSASYEYLVGAWLNTSYSLSDATFCPNVTCN